MRYHLNPAPSFFSGSLIARFGVRRVMLAGVALLGLHVAVASSGVGLGTFATALVLLGVGWNFLYVGGPTLLTTTDSPAEPGRAQATNDMTIFVVGLLASLAAGAMVERFGWRDMNGLAAWAKGEAASAPLWGNSFLLSACALAIIIGQWALLSDAAEKEK